MHSQALPLAASGQFAPAAILSVMAGCILLSAAVAKARDRATPPAGLHRLTGRSATLAAVLLVAAETLLGALLVTRTGGQVGILIAGTLFSAFAVSGAIILAQGNRGIPCGCFGKSLAIEVTWTAISLNAVIAIGLVAYGIAGTTTSLGPSTFSGIVVVCAFELCLIYWTTLYAASVISRVSADQVAAHGR